MTSETSEKRFCCEDISKIENYELAIADKSQTWDCHHRAEILPCGRFTLDDLKKFGLYWKRPACELIFLTHGRHMALHMNNVSEEYRAKMSEAVSGEKNGFFGKHHSAEALAKMSAAKRGKKLSAQHRAKMSAAHKGHPGWMKGKFWFTDGRIEMLARECPGEGWKRGRLKREI